MDLTRFGVLIWLFLPIPIYGLIRSWYYAQIRKYPSTTTGKIVEIVSYGGSGEYDAVGNTTVTYTYSVEGTDYTGRATIGGRHHKPGQEMPIPSRYNPNRPEESRLADLGGIVRGWVLLGLFVLSIDLGLCFFIVFIGLLCVLAGVTIAQRGSPQLRLTPLRKILYSIFCILIGLPLVIIGFYELMITGFPSQNILWALWNHSTIG